MQFVMERTGESQDACREAIGRAIDDGVFRATGFPVGVRGHEHELRYIEPSEWRKARATEFRGASKVLRGVDWDADTVFWTTFVGNWSLVRVGVEAVDLDFWLRTTSPAGPRMIDVTPSSEATSSRRDLNKATTAARDHRLREKATELREAAKAAGRKSFTQIAIAKRIAEDERMDVETVRRILNRQK